MIYEFAPGSRIPRGLDPQACGEYIDAMPSRSPADIVAASRDPMAPTHGAFSWTISGAAARQKVWELEAGHLVRAIRIVVEDVVDDDSTDPARLPAYVSIVERDAERPTYLRTYEALSDVDYRLQVLADAKRELLSWRRRYGHLVELARVIDAINEATQPEPEPAPSAPRGRRTGRSKRRAPSPAMVTI